MTVVPAAPASLQRERDRGIDEATHAGKLLIERHTSSLDTMVFPVLATALAATTRQLLRAMLRMYGRLRARPRELHLPSRQEVCNATNGFYRHCCSLWR